MQRKSLVAKTLWSALNAALATFAAIVTNVMVARILGPQRLGEFSYLIWLISFVGIFTNPGLVATLTRYLPALYATNEANEAKRLTWWVAKWTMIGDALGVSVIAIIGLKFAESGDGPTWVLLAALFVIQSLASYFASYWTGQQQFHRLTHIAVPNTILLIVGVLAGAYWMGVRGAIVGYIAGQLVPLVLSVRLLASLAGTGNPASETRARVFTFAMHTWIATIVSAFVWTRTEVWFLKHFWNEHAVAMFSTALGFVSLAQIAPSLVSSALGPYFAEKFATKEHVALQRAYGGSIKLMAIVLFPTCLCLAATAPVVVPMLYGHSFASAIVPTAVLLLATTFTGLGNVASGMLYSAERTRYILVASSVAAAVSISAAFLIIPSYGATGAALVRSAVQLALLFGGYAYIWITLGYRLPLARLASILAASLAAAVAAGSITRAWGRPVSLAPAILVAAGVYFSGIRLLRVLDADDRNLLDRLLARMPKAFARITEFIVPIPAVAPAPNEPAH